MPVRIFCQCGTDVTDTVSMWDRKTRSVFWMEENSPSCAACRKPCAVVTAKRPWGQSARTAESRKKLAAR